MTATHIRVRTIIQSLIGAFGLWLLLALGGLAHAEYGDALYWETQRSLDRLNQQQQLDRMQKDYNQRLEDIERQRQFERFSRPSDPAPSSPKRDSGGSFYFSEGDHGSTFKDGKYLGNCQKNYGTLSCVK